MVASFSDWRSLVSSARRASVPRAVSSRASRSDPVIALKLFASAPMSSSRSARITRDRSPFATAPTPSSRRLMGAVTPARSASEMTTARNTSTARNKGNMRSAVARTSALM